MKIPLIARAWCWQMVQGMGEKPQEAREAKAVVEVQGQSQGLYRMMVAEVQLVAVLAEEEEVLAADDRASVAKTTTMTMMILTREERRIPYRNLSDP